MILGVVARSVSKGPSYDSDYQISSTGVITSVVHINE